jgi:hypothetical protein
MRFIWNFLKQNQYLIACGLAGLALLAQLGLLSGTLMQSSSNRAIVQANDNDAGYAVHIANKTRWYKDNGFAAYGPFYYRVVHTLQFFFPNAPAPEGWPEFEQRQKTVHFYLTWVSCLSLFSLSLLLSCLISPSWPLRLSLTTVFVGAFLSDKTWATFLFRAHPDHMFAFLVGLAIWLTLKSFTAQDKERTHKLAALTWGLATCTKLTFSIFAPGLILALGLPFKRDTFMRIVRFFGWAFLGYFLIGFPQTIVLDRPVRFLLDQSNFVGPGGWQTFTNWLMIFADQIWRPAIVFVAGWALFGFGPRSKPVERKTLAKALLLVFVPLILLVSRQFFSSHEHYTYPFIASIFVFFGWLLPRTPLTHRPWESHPVLGVAMILLAGRFAFGLSPQAVNEVYHQQQKCRPEAQLVETQINDALQSGQRVYVDPYVPVARELNPSEVDETWGMSWKQIQPGRQSLLGLRRNYYVRYLGSNPPNEAVQRDNPDWVSSRQFYESFERESPIKDPYGQTWTQSYSDSCGWQIWKLTK